MLSKKSILLLFLLVISVAFASPAFAQYTPMVRLPGLPATGSISLQMYLVGLYNFMVSIVGIVAVMMMIVGGMRYITAGGSSSAIGDAKEIVTSAVSGLVLAIFAWLIVSAINPDVLYIKKPGLGSVSTISAYSCVQTYVAPATCVCPDTSVLAGPFATEADCNNACKVGSHCGSSTNKCFREGVNDTTIPKFNTYPNNGKCLCIDGADIIPGSPTCQASCETSNCLVADLRIGVFNDAQIANAGGLTNLRIKASGDGTKTNPFYITNTDYNPCTNVIFEGEKFSHFTPPAWYDWDQDWDGVYDSVAGLPAIVLCNNSYSDVLALNPPRCYHQATPKAYICIMKLKVTETTSGHFKEDELYYGWLEP